MTNQKTKNLGQAFETIASQHANRRALLFSDGRSVTYRELDQTANRLARFFLAQGVRPGQVIALLDDKQLTAFAARLASLKIGAIYTHLDPKSSPARLRECLATCRPRLVIGETTSAPPGTLGASWKDLERESVDGDGSPLPETSEVAAEDAAYLTFTGGAMGATLSHDNVLRFIDWAQARFQLRPDDVVANVNALSADHSIFEFYGALFTGATLAPFADSLVQNARELAKLVDKQGCTIWFSAPSLLIHLSSRRALQKGEWQAMRQIVFGGEAFPKSRLREIFDLYSAHARFTSVYSRAECTSICSSYDVGPEDFLTLHGRLPLGHLNPGYHGYVLGEDGREVAMGQVGELCLEGPLVGQGYYNNREATERSFQFSDGTWTLYRTGERVQSHPETGQLRLVPRDFLEEI